MSGFDQKKDYKKLPSTKRYAGFCRVIAGIIDNIILYIFSIILVCIILFGTPDSIIYTLDFILVWLYFVILNHQENVVH